MAEKLSILCFGDSLTAGYHRWGLEYHPYAIKLTDILAAEFPNAERTIDVNGVSGDLVIYPPGSFLSRIQEECAKKQYDLVIFLGGTNDLGYGNRADMIYYALKDCWDVALATGANVLALTVPECGVKSDSLDTRRDTLNSHILEHQAERYHVFDLHSKIPYHTASETFRDEMFDDGLHLTAKGYDLMGTVVGEHIVNLIKGKTGQ